MRASLLIQIKNSAARHVLMCAVVCLAFLMACGEKKSPKPAKETPRAPRGITKLEDGLWLGEMRTEKNEPLYLAFEKVGESNQEFWRTYVSQSEKIARTLKSVALYFHKGLQQRIDYTAPDNPTFEIYPHSLASLLAYSKDEYDALINYINQSSKGGYNDDRNYGSSGRLFANVLGGLAGMIYVVTAPPKNTEVFVVYGARKPITRRSRNSDYQEERSFFENFGHIVMTMSGINFIDRPVVTHYGITKNIKYFFNNNDEYRGVSLMLHGFAATVWQEFFKGKDFMHTTPIGKMGDILASKIPDDSIFVGRFPPQIQQLIDAREWKPITMGRGQSVTVLLKSLATFFTPLQ